MLLTIGTISGTSAFIPLVEVLLSVFNCRKLKQWDDAGFVCYSGGHAALAAVAAILATIFFLLCTCFTAIVDSHPLSPAATAKTSGEADFRLLVIKASLVVVCNVVPSNVDGDLIAPLVVLANGVAAVAWLKLVLWYLPSLQERVNMLGAMLPAAYLWIVVCKAVTFVKEWDPAAATSFLYLGLPFAAAAGAAACYHRQLHILNAPLSALKSPWEYDFRIRHMLARSLEASIGLPDGQLASSSSAGGPSDGAADVEGVHAVNDDVTGIMGSPRGAGQALGRYDSFITLGERRLGLGGSHPPRGAGPAVSAELDLVSYSVLDADARAEIARQRLPASVLAHAESLYRTCAARFPGSAVVHVLQARFFSVFRADTRLSMSHYLQASRLSDSLFVQLLAYSSRREQDSASAGNGDLSLLLRVTFEKSLTDAKAQVRRAINAQCAFWAELASDAPPNITKLHRLATSFARASRDAEALFTELLNLNPASLVALRLYGQFCLSVANKEKAAGLLAEAERVEDQKSREHDGTSAGGLSFTLLGEVPPDVLSDATAIMTLGATPRDIGIIQTASSQACRVFGYSRFQLERRSFSACLAPGLGESVLHLLSRYIGTGEAPLAITDSCRTVLGRTKSGALIPLYLSVRDSPPTSGDAPSLVAVVREVRTSDDFVVADGRSMHVQAASAGVLAALDMDAGSLAGSGITLESLIEDYHSVRDTLLSTAGAVVTLRIGGSDSPNGTGGDSDGGSRGALAGGIRAKARLQVLNLRPAPTVLLTFHAVASPGASGRGLAAAIAASNANKTLGGYASILSPLRRASTSKPAAGPSGASVQPLQRRVSISMASRADDDDSEVDARPDRASPPAHLAAVSSQSVDKGSPSAFILIGAAGAIAGKHGAAGSSAAFATGLSSPGSSNGSGSEGDSDAPRPRRCLSAARSPRTAPSPVFAPLEKRPAREAPAPPPVDRDARSEGSRGSSQTSASKAAAKTLTR